MSSCAPGVKQCARCQTVHWVHVRPSPSPTSAVRVHVRVCLLTHDCVTCVRCVCVANLAQRAREPVARAEAREGWRGASSLNPPMLLYI